jgi:hypothetical protein
MGKTRLCTALRARAEKIGATVMEGSCSEADLALPYLPFLEAIGNHLSTGGTDELRERLGVHARELAKVFPQLAGDSPAGSESETRRWLCRRCRERVPQCHARLRKGADVQAQL